jgi:hypothetical protein
VPAAPIGRAPFKVPSPRRAPRGSGRKSAVPNLKPQIRNLARRGGPQSEIPNLKSQIRNPKSEISNPRSEIRNPQSQYAPTRLTVAMMCRKSSKLTADGIEWSEAKM